MTSLDYLGDFVHTKNSSHDLGPPISQAYLTSRIPLSSYLTHYFAMTAYMRWVRSTKLIQSRCVPVYKLVVYFCPKLTFLKHQFFETRVQNSVQGARKHQRPNCYFLSSYLWTCRLILLRLLKTEKIFSFCQLSS